MYDKEIIYGLKELWNENLDLQFIELLNLLIKDTEVKAISELSDESIRSQLEKMLLPFNYMPKCCECGTAKDLKLIKEDHNDGIGELLYITCDECIKSEENIIKKENITDSTLYCKNCGQLYDVKECDVASWGESTHTKLCSTCRERYKRLKNASVII